MGGRPSVQFEAGSACVLFTFRPACVLFTFPHIPSRILIKGTLEFSTSSKRLFKCEQLRFEANTPVYEYYDDGRGTP